MPSRIYGLETEYAIAYENPDRTLVGLASEGDLRGELFHQLEAAILRDYQHVKVDQHGRQVRRDQENSDEALVHPMDGYFVENGARFYLDVGHVEWSTPEATTPGHAIAYDLAGEHILRDAAQQVSHSPSGRLMLLKNNVDYIGGNTYGCHENYLVQRFEGNEDAHFFDALTNLLIPFLVTRQILCGAGKIGAQNSSELGHVGYQISQRADFILQQRSDDTRNNRALIDTRDEPLSDDQRFRRLHLIVGDSNMSPFASMFKVGVTGILLQMAEEQTAWRPPELANPLAALRRVSRDLTGQRALRLRTGGSMTALQIQREYYNQALRHFLNRHNTDMGDVFWLWNDLLSKAEEVLPHALEDPDMLAVLADRVDWVTKFHYVFAPRLRRYNARWSHVAVWNTIIQTLLKERGSLNDLEATHYMRFEPLLREHQMSWNDFPLYRSLFFELRETDLRYHDIHPERGLYYFLKQKDKVVGFVQENDLNDAKRTPPHTRAECRTAVIRWANDADCAEQIGMDWNRIALAAGNSRAIVLDDPFQTDYTAILKQLQRAMQSAPNLNPTPTAAPLPNPAPVAATAPGDDWGITVLGEESVEEMADKPKLFEKFWSRLKKKR